MSYILLIVAVFIFEVLSIGLGWILLMLVSGIEFVPWLKDFIDKHDGTILVILILAYNLWKAFFIVKHLTQYLCQ